MLSQAHIDLDWVREQLRRNLSSVLSPNICQQLMGLLEQPEVSFVEVAKLLQRDPYIACRVVSLANMLSGERHEPVRTLHRAVQLLGVRHMQMLTLSVMLAGPLGDSQDRLSRRRDLWRYVLACGVAGDFLGRHYDASTGRINIPDSDTNSATQSASSAHLEFFTGGLVMGLGSLVLYAGIGRPYARMLGLPLRPLDLDQREQQALGVTQHQVTMWTLQAMRCPKELAALSQSLADERDDKTARLARVIRVFGAKIAGNESSLSVVLLNRLLPDLGVQANQLLGPTLRRLRHTLRELMAVFNVRVEQEALPVDQRQQALQEVAERLRALQEDQINSPITAQLLSPQIDPVTQLPNQDSWTRRLMALDMQHGRMALTLIDVDRFSSWSRDEAAGDRVLQTVAKAIMSTQPVHACRLGRDVFAALYPVSDKDALATLANTIAVAVGHATRGWTSPHLVTLAIAGVIDAVERLAVPEPSAMDRAAELLRQAKQQGHGRILLENA